MLRQCLADDAKERGFEGRERMIIAISLRSLLTAPQDGQSELWNPTGGVTIAPSGDKQWHRRERLIEHAQSIRSQVVDARTPAFVQRLLWFMKYVGTSPVTIRRQGCIDSHIMLLSSWGHADFSKLTLDHDSNRSDGKPILLQHELRYVRWLPTPWIMSPTVCICHKTADRGYCLEANLTESMWDKVSKLDFEYIL